MPAKRTNPSADVYLRFLQLAAAIGSRSGLPPLDPLEERILAQVALANREEQRLSVRDMMGRDELGAPATIHGRLKSMRAKGWITLADTEDARRKQLALTRPALKHFEKLARAVVQAARAAG